MTELIWDNGVKQALKQGTVELALSKMNVKALEVGQGSEVQAYLIYRKKWGKEKQLDEIERKKSNFQDSD